MCQVFDTCDYFSCLVPHTVMYTLSARQIIMKPWKARTQQACRQLLLEFMVFMVLKSLSSVLASLLTLCYSRVQPVSCFYDLHFYLLSAWVILDSSFSLLKSLRGTVWMIVTATHKLLTLVKRELQLRHCLCQIGLWHVGLFLDC